MDVAVASEDDHVEEAAVVAAVQKDTLPLVLCDLPEAMNYCSGQLPPEAAHTSTADDELSLELERVPRQVLVPFLVVGHEDDDNMADGVVVGDDVGATVEAVDDGMGDCWTLEVGNEVAGAVVGGH